MLKIKVNCKAFEISAKQLWPIINAQNEGYALVSKYIL